MKSILILTFLLSTYSFGIVSELAFNKKSTDIIGKPKITDGDTIVINDIRIRFTGSDAPESYFFGKTQTCIDSKGQEWECGKAATEKLKQLINGQTVRCSDEGKDRYGRTVGELFANGKNVQEAMVSSGRAQILTPYAHQCEWTKEIGA